MQDSATVTMLKYFGMANAGSAGTAWAKHDYLLMGAHAGAVLIIVVIVYVIKAREP